MALPVWVTLFANVRGPEGPEGPAVPQSQVDATVEARLPAAVEDGVQATGGGRLSNLGAQVSSAATLKDLNLLPATTGWFRALSTAENLPETGAQFNVFNMAFSGTSSAQIAVRASGSAGEAMFFRSQRSGVWAQWQALTTSLDDSMVRTVAVDHPKRSHVVHSADLREIGGTRRDDSGDLSLERGHTRIDLDSGPAGVVHVTNDYRRIEPGGEGSADGLTPQEILDSWAERMGSATAGAAFTALAGWGDSMTTDFQSQGVNQTLQLASELGVTGFDRGVSGDTPYQIAWRLGALRLDITIADGVLPASGAVPVTVNIPQGWNQARSWPVIVHDTAGQVVLATLAQATTTPSGTPTWTLAQRAGASARTLAPHTRVTHEQSLAADVQRAPATFWLGRNDPDPTRVGEALSAMLAAHRDPLRRRLVRPIFNKTSEPDGSAGYTTVMACNEVIAEIAGADFYDDRAALIEWGLDAVDLTPTAEDLAAIAQDCIPPALMLDTTHLNATGRRALARIDAIEISGRNWT